jgi:alpha-amylase/alpha-mannosidase (GH57 family)
VSELTPLVVHGHFYQPPRENPWTEVLDREPSAAPAHDWNERIYEECYRANAYCRIVDGFGRVERIIDNYAKLSFNFGPTLLSWLERNHSTTYKRIIDSDRASRQQNRGHGNAIAQGYNHAILPLMTPRDRRTQIRWGLADFRRRFGREPESLWLPETACNDATVEDLIDEGLRFVILSPHQAARVRPIGGEEWTDVSNGSIDTSQPYVWNHPDGSNRSISIFFYQGDIAQAIAFQGALSSSQSLIDQLKLRVKGPMLNVATDGETYGHHVKAGDRTLAYALNELAPRAGFRVTNYGAFLEEHEPTFEVEIKAGEDDLGTAWSCYHGVGRWYRDCGCSTSGREGWNQAWRGPLRKALDDLNECAGRVFEEQGGELFADVWAARDAYIEVILDRAAGPDAFLALHAKRALADAERTRALTLLELQRSSQLMFTSCGWFFSEISGLETVQVMKYAGRALDLLGELGVSYRNRFLEILSQGRSNLQEMGTGADVFRRFVDPSRVTKQRLAAHLAICSLVEEEPEENGEEGLHLYRADEIERQKHGRVTVYTAKVTIDTLTTKRTREFSVAAIHFGGADFYCAVKPFPRLDEHRQSAKRLFAALRTASLPKLLRIAQEEFGPEEFGLEGILPDARERISATIFGGLVRRFLDQYAAMFEENRRSFEMLQSAGFTLPAELRATAEFTLGKRFEEEILEHKNSTDPDAYKKAIEIAEEVALGGFHIDRTVARQIFTDMITDSVWRAIDSGAEGDLQAALDLLELTHRLGIDADLSKAQEALYERRESIVRSHPLKRLATPLKLSPLVFPDEPPPRRSEIPARALAGT